MKMRKLISLVLALVMVLGLAVPAMAAAESVQETAGGRLLSLGVIEGYTDGTLGLDKTITRAEIAVVLARIAGMGEAADLLKDTPSKFSDVKTGEWYTGWINLASSQGWVVGDPQGTFRPNDSISYREIVTVLLKVLGYDDNLPGDWPTNFLAKAASLGITKGIVSDSKAPAVRGDVFVMTSRTLDEETVKYDKDTGKFEESGKTLLVDKMDLEKADGVVTAIPRVSSSLKDNQIKIDGTTYKVAGNVDFEAIFGCDVDAWLNADDEIVFVDVASKEVLFDALKDVNEDELTLVDADDDYDVADDVVFFVDGRQLKSSEIKALNNATFDYAKVVLNDDGDVAFVDAYNWDDYVVVEEVKGDEIFGYGEELDAEDFTIVKDGKTISIEDVKEGDIVFYNSKAEFAEVFVSTVEGEIEEIFENEFEVAGKSFSYDYKEGIPAKYINEDGKIGDFDDEVAEQMEEEGAVVVFIDRAGNAVFVSGDLGAVQKSTFGAVLYEPAVAYYDTRDNACIELKVVTEEGTAVTYDFRLNDLDELAKDGTEIEVNKTNVVTLDDQKDIDKNKYDDVKVSTLTVALDEIALAGDIVEITVDDAGDVVGLTFFANVDPVTDGESGKTYVENKRMNSKVPVFIIDGMSAAGFDDDDVEVTTYGELDDDVEFDGHIVYDGAKALYLVITDSSMTKTTKKLAVITQVRNNSEGNITRIKALVDGEEVTYYAEDPIAPASWEAGSHAMLEIIDANGRLDNILAVLYDDSFEVDEKFEVITKDRVIKPDKDDDSVVYELVSDGYIYDISDPSDIEQMSFSELKDVKVDTSITVVFDAVEAYEVTGRYVKFILVGAEPADDDDDDPAEGAINVTYTTGTLTVTVTDDIEDAFAVRVYDVDSGDAIGGFKTLTAGSAEIQDAEALAQNPVFVLVKVYDETGKLLAEQQVTVE